MFEVTARMRIRDGELDGFKQRAAMASSRRRRDFVSTTRTNAKCRDSSRSLGMTRLLHGAVAFWRLTP